jgi:hypothetical protein
MNINHQICFNNLKHAKFAIFTNPRVEYNWFELSWETDEYMRWLACFWIFNFSVMLSKKLVKILNEVD